MESGAWSYSNDLGRKQDAWARPPPGRLVGLLDWPLAISFKQPDPENPIRPRRPPRERQANELDRFPAVPVIAG